MVATVGRGDLNKLAEACGNRSPALWQARL